jgi:hypothetical protein
MEREIERLYKDKRERAKEERREKRKETHDQVER